MLRTFFFTVFFAGLALGEQLPPKEYRSYRPHIAGSGECTAWFGRRVAVVLEGETPGQRDAVVMATICTALDGVFDAFERITGREPELSAPLEGRARVEVSAKVGGGLAHHGTLGIAVGPGFFAKLYERVKAGEHTYDQVFFYEIARNYWMGDMNPAIDYHTADGEDSYGWWTVGFNNAMSVVVSREVEGVDDLFYFGSGGEAFARGMTANLDTYLAHPDRYTWENSWCRNLVPWSGRTSVNDLMTGLLLRLAEQHGGARFMAGLYREIPRQRPRPSGRSDYRRARDNFYKAASLAAGEDLWAYFTSDLRWELGDKARAVVRARSGAEPARAPFRTFTNLEGKTFRGRLHRLEGAHAVIVGENGRTYRYPLGGLSPEDREFLRKDGRGASEK